MSPLRIAALYASLVLCLAVPACRGGGELSPPTNGDEPPPPPVPEIQEHPLCPFGVPLVTGEHPLGETVLVEHTGYVLEYSLRDRVPVWVSQHWSGYELGVKQAPLDTGTPNWAAQAQVQGIPGPVFGPDPALAPTSQASLADYRVSTFDRGRLAVPLRRSPSREIVEETYYLTNVAPQVGTGFGRGVWSELEDQVRRALERRGEAFVITGCFNLRRTAPTIGPRKVVVPSHFYKIVVSRSARGGWESVAFVLENRPHREKAPDLKDYLRKIDWIEKRAGIDFMPLLDEEQERLLEGEVGEIWPSLRRL